jgi:uncharacterized HAD superfamily protein
MEKIKIWVDLDEVLADSLNTILEFNKYQINWKWVKREDITNYHIYKMLDFNISKEWAFKWYDIPLRADAWKNKIKPIKWALTKLTQLKSESYELVVITARGEEGLWNYSRDWIEKFYSWIFSDIVFANHFSEKHKEKHEICKELWITIMIEDDMEYALKLAENWIKTYLLEKPWNSNRNEENSNIIRIKHWEDFKI